MNCEICGEPCPTGRKLAKDHNHATGKQRGRLCLHCNVGLGHFKDNPAILLQAFHYLSRDGQDRHHGKLWTGQIIPKGEQKWLLRFYVGRTKTNKRRYLSTMVRGTHDQATAMLKEFRERHHFGTPEHPKSLSPQASIVD